MLLKNLNQCGIFLGDGFFYILYVYLFCQKMRAAAVLVVLGLIVSQVQGLAPDQPNVCQEQRRQVLHA